MDISEGDNRRVEIMAMSWSLLAAFLPFDPVWLQRIRRYRLKLLRSFDSCGHYRRLVDGAYHAWQAFLGLSALKAVLGQSSELDDLVWPAAGAAKWFFDVALVLKIGVDTISLVGAGRRRRKWTLQALDSAFHRLCIIIVIARLQFYVSLAVYDSEAIELELLLLLKKVCINSPQVSVVIDR